MRIRIFLLLTLMIILFSILPHVTSSSSTSHSNTDHSVSTMIQAKPTFVNDNTTIPSNYIHTLDPNVVFVTGYLTNSAVPDIFEIHKSVIYFRYGTNYSIFKTYSSKFDTINYFPIQYNHTNYGLLVEYNKIDNFSTGGSQVVKRSYKIILVNDKGNIIASNNFIDLVDGTNVVGGMLFGEFNSSINGPEILLSYDEQFQFQNGFEQSFTQILLFRFSSLQLINAFLLNNYVYLNRNYSYNYSTPPQAIPAIEKNVTSKLSRVVIFSDVSFQRMLFTSDWYPDNSLTIKTISNYANNSYLLMKVSEPKKNTISLFTFNEQYSQILDTRISALDSDTINSNIIVRKYSNNTLAFLVQYNHKIYWKDFSNKVLSTQSEPPQSFWLYKGLINYSNDNIPDFFIIAFTNNTLSNFIIQDGVNQKKVLANIPLHDMRIEDFYSNFFIGTFTTGINSNTSSLEQVLFIYNNQFLKLVNNGTIDKPYLVFYSPVGNTIKACPSTIITLKWYISSYVKIKSIIYSANSIYTVNNEQNISLPVTSTTNTNSFTKNYTLVAITVNGQRFIGTILIHFNPNECLQLTYPTPSNNVVQNSFDGVKIPDLPIIISTIIIVTVVLLSLIYYWDHKKI